MKMSGIRSGSHRFVANARTALRRRQRGPISGVHNEWSLIVASVESPPDRLVQLALSAAARTLSSRGSLLRPPRLDLPEFGLWPGEHYLLLPCLAEEWGASHVVEIGTFQGASALALLEAPTVTSLVTFDIIPWDSIPGTFLQPGDFGSRFSQRVADVARPAEFADCADLLNNADLIFIDGPKDGVFESAFCERLLASDATKDQLLVFDDIRVATMLEFWLDLPLEKFDMTSFGHWSGTGLAIRRRQPK